MKFREKFICIEEGFSSTCPCGTYMKNPKKDDIVTLHEGVWRYGEAWMYFNEHQELPCGCSCGYRPKCFAPLDKYLEQYSIEELIKTEEYVRKETK